MPEPKLYQFSVAIGSACAKQFKTFADLSEKLNMDLTDLMRQCNGKTRHRKPGQGPVQGTGDQRIVPGETAEEVRKDRGGK
jgi:hypothetical protein